MALEFATQSDIPAGLENDFVEFDKDGSKVWIPTDTADALKAQFRLQGDMSNMTKAQETLQTQMTELTSANSLKEQALIDEKELLRKAGLSSDERIQEMFADFDKRMTAKEDESKAEIALLRNTANQKTVDATVAELATAATPSNQKILQMMIKNDLKVNDDGTFIINDENGKATSLTLGEYKDSLAERYPTLTTAVQSQGGEGKGNSGEVVNLGNKKYSELDTPAEKAAFLARKNNRKI